MSNLASLNVKIDRSVKRDADTIAEELERIRQKRLSAKGSLKGKIRMSADFNASLEEMEEYM